MIDTLARALSFMGALVCIGAVPARALIRHAWRDPALDPVREAAIRRLTRIAWAAAISLPVAALFSLHAQAAAMVDDGERLALIHYQVVLGSTWAGAWKAQLAVGLLTVVAWAPWRGRPFLGPNLAPLAALAIAATFPLMGHPRVVPAGAILGVLTTAFHILGASLWLGSLTLVTAVAWMGPPEGRTARVAAIIAGFSPLALAGAALAAFTGVVTAWQTVGGFAPLVQTIYGRTLLLKLGILAFIAALGAYNWRVARPRLDTGHGEAALHRSALAEVLLGVALLVATAFLVALPAPGLD